MHSLSIIALGVFTLSGLILQASPVKVAIIAEDFSGDAAAGDLEMLESVATAAISKKSGVVVIGRRNIQSLVNEKDLAALNIRSDKNLVGRLLGADFLLSIGLLKKTSNQRSETISAYGMTEKKVYTQSSAQIAFKVMSIANQIEEVKVKGAGSTPQLAIDHAKNEAIRQALGVFLDGKTLIENEEVVQDRILSLSDGYIKSYSLISNPALNPSGIYETEISARIPVGEGRVVEEMQIQKRLDNSRALGACADDLKSALQGLQLASTDLMPAVSGYTINVAPSKAGKNLSGLDIFVNGNFVGNTPFQLTLPSGAYELSIRRGSAVLWNNRLQVGSDLKISPDLTEL